MLETLTFIQQYNTFLLATGVALTILGFAWRLKNKLTEEKDFSTKEGKGDGSAAESANISKAQSVFRRMQ